MKIAWIGTGIMGAPMAGHLMTAGHTLTVYNRTKSKARDLVERGAIWADSAAAAVEDVELVFTMLGYPHDVEEMYLGANGILATMRSGAATIDMTTSSPSLAETIAEEAESRGIRALDAPVSGGDVGAQNATLAIMCGGERALFDDVRPLLDLLGKNVRLLGGPGRGQATKMVNQIAIASTMIGVAEALIFAEASGLDQEAVIAAIGSGAAASWTLSNLGPRIVAGDMEPGFMVMHYIKDLGIALAEAKKMGLALPGLAQAEQFYRAASGTGWDRKGTQIVSEVLRRLNGLPRS